MRLIDHVVRHGDCADLFLTESRVIKAKEAALLSVCTSVGDGIAGKTILLALEDPLLTAIALVELDGRARRLVITPPELPTEAVFDVGATAGADLVFSDRGICDCRSGPSVRVVQASLCIGAHPPEPVADTEWVLLTSGTSGAIKLAQHSLASLTQSTRSEKHLGTGIRWGTLYDLTRFAGVQVFLQAVLGGAGLILTRTDQGLTDRLGILSDRGVTHLSGTPSLWRRVLMSPLVHRLALRQITLGGEIADQAILDGLRGAFPCARITHIYASTEAGVGFSVNDGRAGFPTELLHTPPSGVELRVSEGRLWVRSARAAQRYIAHDQTLTNADGFIDTGDAVELRNGRYYFLGRASGAINVGGMKVRPEEVECIINAAPDVYESRVYARKNPFTGHVVVADVVLRSERGEVSGSTREADARARIINLCRDQLLPHMVPAVIRFVGAVKVGAAGKVGRHGA
jgi:acyl-CoA synthetase (AMP-forming)/AMP-acid ligase II